MSTHLAQHTSVRGSAAEFADLICADEELLRAEFDAIIAAGWPPAVRGTGCRRDRPPAGSRGGKVLDIRSQDRDSAARRARSRQRSPPRPATRQPPSAAGERTALTRPCTAVARGDVMSQGADERVQDHQDDGWVALAHRLVERFPRVAAGEVIENITRNRQAADAFGLAEAEHLPTVETMTRYQLMQLSGDVPDNARYKPEAHVARNRSVDPDGGPSSP
jgi:hypothetical protein